MQIRQDRMGPLAGKDGGSMCFPASVSGGRGKLPVPKPGSRHLRSRAGVLKVAKMLFFKFREQEDGEKEGEGQ